MTLRVLLADDHTIVRYSLRRLLESRGSVRVVAEAANGREAVERTREHEPDLVLMDVAMPEMDGVQATRRILEVMPQVRVLALSGHSDEQLVAQMLRAGASGYVLKEAGADELHLAVERVARGGAYLSSGARDAIEGDGGPCEERSSQVLSPRERDVLTMLADGKTAREIAAELAVSVKTVETHRARIMAKLNLRSVAELTKYAIRSGLTTLDLR